RVEESGVVVQVSASNASCEAWTPVGKFTVPLVGEGEGAKPRGAVELADAVAEKLLGRLVEAQLVKGPREKGNKETYKIKIVNASPLILTPRALPGPADSAETRPTGLAGLSLPPRKYMTLPATAEMVERLGLKGGIKVIAADLSGL